jgi:hypothetical protein
VGIRPRPGRPKSRSSQILVGRPPKKKWSTDRFFSTEISTDREMTDREKTVDCRPKLHMLFSVSCRDRLGSDRRPFCFPTAGLRFQILQIFYNKNDKKQQKTVNTS